MSPAPDLGCKSGVLALQIKHPEGMKNRRIPAEGR
jgi:hypothetical protein